MTDEDYWSHIGTAAWLRRLADKWPDKTEADALRCHADTVVFRDREWLAMRDHLGIPTHEPAIEFLAVARANPTEDGITAQQHEAQIHAEVGRTTERPYTRSDLYKAWLAGAWNQAERADHRVSFDEWLASL